MRTKEEILASIFRPKTVLEVETRSLVYKNTGTVIAFKELENGCVEPALDLVRNGRGYYRLSIQGEKWLLHRLVFFLAYPNTIGSMSVLHTCDNPACCRLDHLFAGTDSDNMQDMANKDRGNFRRGVNHPNSKLTQQQIDIIRNTKCSWGVTRRLAREYGVDHSAISRIRTNQQYKSSPI